MRVTAPASPLSNSTPPRIRRRAPYARDVILLGCDVDDHRDRNGTPWDEVMLARDLSISRVGVLAPSGVATRCTVLRRVPRRSEPTITSCPGGIEVSNHEPRGNVGTGGTTAA